METERKYLVISYTTCIFALVMFATYAVVRYTLHRRAVKQVQDADNFITARGTMPALRIALSYFATAVGAWCLVSPSQFAVYNGMLALSMYAFASGIPILIISFFGADIQQKHPGVVSISDFAGKRFGPVFRTVVVLLCLFNMGIAMLAEYTTIGSLFQDFVGSVDYPIVICVGIITMAYTAYGGVFISIMTDQLQAWLTFAFIIVLCIYVGVTFKEDIPNPLPDNLGVTHAGYSAIFSMPCSLLAATVFSEAVWQKVWASSSRRAVILGGIGGSILIMIAVFIFGFFGWLAMAGGLSTLDYEYDSDGNSVPIINPNLFTFQIFQTDAKDLTGSGPSQAHVRSWVGVICLILTITMNASAVDSLQSGLTGTITSHFFRDQHIIFTRLAVVLLNIPVMIVSTRGYNILQLFLVSNMLTSCCFLPVLLGVFDWTRKLVTETASIFGCVIAILTTCAYGAGRWWNESQTADIEPQPIDGHGQALKYGINYAWYNDINYDWDYFLVASGSSVVGVALWVVGAQLLKALTGIEGPGISGILSRLPGFGFITGAGLGFDLLSAITCGHWTHDDLTPSISITPSKEEVDDALKPQDMSSKGDVEGSYEPVQYSPAQARTLQPMSP